MSTPLLDFCLKYENISQTNVHTKIQFPIIRCGHAPFNKTAIKKRFSGNFQLLMVE